LTIWKIFSPNRCCSNRCRNRQDAMVHLAVCPGPEPDLKTLGPHASMHPFFRWWIGKVEADWEKVKVPHPQNRFGRTSWAVLFELVGFDHPPQCLPRQDLVHGSSEQVSSGGVALAVPAAARGAGLLSGEVLEVLATHWFPPLGYPLNNSLPKTFLLDEPKLCGQTRVAKMIGLPRGWEKILGELFLPLLDSAGVDGDYSNKVKLRSISFSWVFRPR